MTRTPRPQQPLPFISQEWLKGVSLIVLVILTYLPVWRAGFAWDDDVLLTANPVIAGPLGLKEIWTTSAADICPLTLTLFWVEHFLWGFAPLPYHIVNVLLHGTSAVLLWRVLIELNSPGAWIGAALWALHPVEVESVAAICEMKNTLSGVFFMLSVLCFSKWLGPKDFGRYALTLIFATLAMASKTSTVTLPMVLCLCAWWKEGRWHWRNLINLLPLFFVTIAASALSIWTQGLQLSAFPLPQDRTFLVRLLTAGDVIWFYLGKLLWPHPLILAYPNWEIRSGEWISYIPLLSGFIVCAVFWFYRISWSRACFFALSYFIVCLLPVMGFFNQIWFWNSPVADHLQYLASIGPLALLGAGITNLAKIYVPKPRGRLIFFLGLLLLLSSITWQRTWAFHDRDTLWRDTVAKNPSYWPGYNHIGFDLLQKGMAREAIPFFEKALVINPGSAKTHNNLGVALAQTEGLDSGIEHFRRALEIDPKFAEAYGNLGLALLDKGQFDEAIAQYQQALQIDPNNAINRMNMCDALLMKGRLEEATTQLKEALRLEPNLTGARNALRAIETIARHNHSPK